MFEQFIGVYIFRSDNGLPCRRKLISNQRKHMCKRLFLNDFLAIFPVRGIGTEKLVVITLSAVLWRRYFSEPTENTAKEEHWSAQSDMEAMLL